MATNKIRSCRDPRNECSTTIVSDNLLAVVMTLNSFWNVNEAPLNYHLIAVDILLKTEERWSRTLREQPVSSDGLDRVTTNGIPTPFTTHWFCRSLAYALLRVFGLLMMTLTSKWCRERYCSTNSRNVDKDIGHNCKWKKNCPHYSL